MFAPIYPMSFSSLRSVLTSLLICSGLTVNAFAENELVTVESRTVAGAEATTIVTEPSHLPEGHAASPSPLYSEITSRSGQAFVLALTRSEGSTFKLLTYHAITDTWASAGSFELSQDPLSIQPIDRGFLIQVEGETLSLIHI